MMKMDSTEEEKANERKSAVCALKEAVARVLDIEMPSEEVPGDYGEDNLPEYDWGTDFLFPLARRLVMPPPPAPIADGTEWVTWPRTKEEAEKLKKQACKFVSDVVDHMFRGLLRNQQAPVIRASQVITFAFKYCQEIDHLPTKMALRSYLGNVPEVGFLNPTDYREMLKMAALDGLPEGKSGPKNTHGKPDTKKRG